MSDRNSKLSLSVLTGVFGLFLLGRLFGADLFDNNWSFVHWRLQPTWYPIVWSVLAIIVGFLLYRYAQKTGEFFTSPTKVAFGLAGLLVLLIIFGFDSIVSGYGNRRLGQIAQADVIIYRWFELGSIGLVGCLYRFLQNFIVSNYTAALLSWKIFNYTFTLLTMIGSVLLVKQFQIEKSRRLLYFLILFFGSQTPVYFGFVGVEAVVPAFCIWFALFSMSALDNRTGLSLLALWVTVALGVTMHVSLAFLVPAALFVTLVVLFKRLSVIVPVVVALGSCAVLIWFAYQWAGSSMEYMTLFLFAKGKLPHADYGLFDLRHLGDIIQLLFLVAPVVLAVKWSLMGQLKQMLKNRTLLFVWLMCLGGLTWVFISDPRQSIVLELPRLVAYFAPFSIFVLVLVRQARETIVGVKAYLPLVATAAIMVPMTFLPSYTSVVQSERIVDDYMEREDNYYHDACVAYRDAYFVRGEYTESDRWERRMVVKSDEYLNIRGSAGLANQANYSEAIRVMHQMIVGNPYWAAPRAQLASMQMQAGRFRMAKPHIDTCLMLEPYNRNHHIQLYAYYRSIGNLPAALETIKKALEFFPNDLDILSDEMLIHFGMGHNRVADSLASELYHVSDSLPFPYLVKGLLAAKSNNRLRAISNFEKFIELAPGEVEAPMIQKRLDSLKAMGAGK